MGLQQYFTGIINHMAAPFIGTSAPKVMPRHYEVEIPVSMGCTPGEFRNKIAQLVETGANTNLFESGIIARNRGAYDTYDGCVIHKPAPPAAIFREIDSHIGRMDGYQLAQYRALKNEICGSTHTQGALQGIHLSVM